MPSLFIKVINSTAVQATWEPSIKLGQHEGFKLYYRKVHLSQYTGPTLLPSNVTSYNITHLGKYQEGLVHVTLLSTGTFACMFLVKYMASSK